MSKQLKVENRLFFALRSDYFDIGFMEYLTNNAEMHKIFTKKQFTLKDTESRYRLINHWSSVGILDEDRKENSNSWRSFSLLDLCWINVVSQMRLFGMSTEKIKIAKNHLFPDMSKHDDRQKLFGYYISLALMDVRVFVIVLGNGGADFATSSDLEYTEKLLGLQHILRIDFNKVVREVFRIKGAMKQSSWKIDLNEAELLLLTDIRQGGYEEIIIKFKNGKVERFEKSKQIDIQERIVDILREAKYQNIEIKQQDGKIVSIKQKVKQKQV
jgi:DNA-binding transcriptional MerR regulator